MAKSVLKDLFFQNFLSCQVTTSWWLLGSSLAAHWSLCNLYFRNFILLVDSAPMCPAGTHNQRGTCCCFSRSFESARYRSCWFGLPLSFHSVTHVPLSFQEWNLPHNEAHFLPLKSAQTNQPDNLLQGPLSGSPIVAQPYSHCSPNALLGHRGEVSLLSHQIPVHRVTTISRSTYQNVAFVLYNLDF